MVQELIEKINIEDFLSKEFEGFWQRIYNESVYPKVSFNLEFFKNFAVSGCNIFVGIMGDEFDSLYPIKGYITREGKLEFIKYESGINFLGSGSNCADYRGRIERIDESYLIKGNWTSYSYDENEGVFEMMEKMEE